MYNLGLKTSVAIDPNYRTLKRRSGELKAAAHECHDESAAALLLFYAAECVLKSMYMAKFSLVSTSAANALAQSARSYTHRLDDLLRALRVQPTDCPVRPSVARLRDGREIGVDQLHEAWRYGEKIVNHADVIAWLEKVIAYAEART